MHKVNKQIIIFYGYVDLNVTFKVQCSRMEGFLSWILQLLISTGSVDKLPPWQRRVYSDRSQKTFGDLAEHNRFEQPKTRSECMQDERTESMNRQKKEEVCVCVSMWTIQRWKEKQACKYCFSFQGYLLLCRNFKLNPFFLFLKSGIPGDATLSFQQLHFVFFVLQILPKEQKDEVKKKKRIICTHWECYFIVLWCLFYLTAAFIIYLMFWKASDKNRLFCQIISE